MSDTPTDQPSAIAEVNPTPQGPVINYLIAFHYNGEDNGMPKEGFDSRVISIPEGMLIASSKEVKDIAEAMALSLFQDGKKYVGLQLQVLNIQKLPI